MGGQESRQGSTASLKAIKDIYAMFQQSNQVILLSLKENNPGLTKPKIGNIEEVVEQLVEPFRETPKYVWSQQISNQFKNHFTVNFEALWAANREQFYELLLGNCKINYHDLIDKRVEGWSYQNAFYNIAAGHIELTMAETFLGDIGAEEFKHNLRNLSVLGEDSAIHIEPKSQIGQTISASQEHLVSNKMAQKALPRKARGLCRLENSSLIIPQTLFVDRLSVSSQEEMGDLLKFYKQFSNTLQQILCSNNLLSCPLKNFLVCLQEKLQQKKIKTEVVRKEELLGSSEESRKVRKARETNNNIILYEVRAFLEAYNDFVWMFLQLHLMESSSLGSIIQPEVLFGVIFKNLWNFVDWISDRGYQFQESELEEYFAKKSLSQTVTVPEDKLKVYLGLLEQLRGEKHPQSYLKKLVIFYRQVSRDCQTADDLLEIYQDVIKHCALEKGIRDLRLFRMRNIIQKLLRVEESPLSGGEITYSWTTWCIMIELLKEKVNYRYGKLIISKKTSGEAMKLKESQLSWQQIKMNSLRASSPQKENSYSEQPNSECVSKHSGCFNDPELQ